MKKIDFGSIKEKYNDGVCAVKDAYNTAKDITIHPKLSASLTVKSASKNESYIDKDVKLDKEVSLLQIIGVVLAVIAALVAASLIVNAVFSLFKPKKKSKSKEEQTCVDNDSCLEEISD